MKKQLTPKDITKDLKTTSAKIRALAKKGYLRTEISKILDIRYQHVRKVLLDSGITGGLSSVKGKIPKVKRPKRQNYSGDILLKSGFQYAGDWELQANGKIKLNKKIPKVAGVYALLLDDVIVYVGLTLNGLQTHMNQYRAGHKGQKTSSRVNKLIFTSLEKGCSVKLLIATPSPLEWNGLPVNTSPGLEAGLIESIRPEWNIQGAS